jgi:hypothetical protein
MSVLDQVRKLEQQVVDRLKELEPLTREYEQLRKLAERLGVKYSPRSAASDGDANRSTAAKPKAARSRAPAAKKTAKPRGTRSTTRQRTTTSAQTTGATAAATPRAKRAGTGTKRAGARRAGAARPGQRQDDVLRLVAENPGITVRELGERLGVDATGLYRVVKRLTDDGRVRKDDTRLHLAESGTSSAPEGAGASAPDASPETGARPPEASASPES